MLKGSFIDNLLYMPSYGWKDQPSRGYFIGLSVAESYSQVEMKSWAEPATKAPAMK